MNNLIKIEKIGGKTIYFDKQMGVFVADDNITSPSYIELKKQLIEDSKTDFEKEFFIVDLGEIRKIKTKKRVFDYFLGEYVYYGKRKDDYLITKYTQKDIYPINKKNKKIYDKQQEIQKKINELEKKKKQLAKELVKS